MADNQAPQESDAHAREERLSHDTPITDEIIDDPDIANHPPIELPEEDQQLADEREKKPD